MTKLLLLAAVAAYACKLIAGRWPWQHRLSQPRLLLQDKRVIEAQKLLGLSAAASREAIITAHRNLIQQVHPDRGGTSEKVHQANAARDVLLAATDPQTTEQP